VQLDERTHERETNAEPALRTLVRAIGLRE
jgi:hypothetical protein